MNYFHTFIQIVVKVIKIFCISMTHWCKNTVVFEVTKICLQTNSLGYKDFGQDYNIHLIVIYTVV